MNVVDMTIIVPAAWRNAASLFADIAFPGDCEGMFQSPLIPEASPHTAAATAYISSGQLPKFYADCLLAPMSVDMPALKAKLPLALRTNPLVIAINNTTLQSLIAQCHISDGTHVVDIDGQQVTVPESPSEFIDRKGFKQKQSTL